MALLANLVLGETIIPNAYYKITKLILASSDVDYFEDDEDGNSQLAYFKEYENIAHVSVYADEESRKRNVIPLKKFALFFEYDLVMSIRNAYEQAYDALKEIESLSNCEITDLL